jgi:hypothetical protein
MADDFTKLKFAWLDQVAADPAVSASAFKLGYFLAARFLNRGTRTAYPSQETLGKLLGISTTRGIKYLADQLVAGGHLAVEASHLRGTTNRYRLIVKADPEPVAESGGQDVDGDKSAPKLFAEMEQPAETEVRDPSTDASASAQGGTSDGDDVPDFDRWWLCYPKKVGKGAARKAYDRIVTTGAASPAELLAGAMRYAAARTDQDPRYTKDPGGWLNAERWTDEIQAAPQGGAPDQRNGASWTEIALAGLRDE